MIYTAHRDRVRKYSLKKGLEKMNAYDSLKRVPLGRFADKLSPKLIEFLGEIIKEE